MLKITSPKIDASSVKTLLQQIRAKVPFYTPEWNPGQEGEAGLALARIYLQMLEQVLFRLNQAPDKNFVAFLDLLGIDLLPAQSARAIVTFKLAEGTLEHVLVSAETQLAAEGAIDGQEVIFETQNDLRVTPAVMTEIFSFDAPNDRIYQHTEAFVALEPFVMFEGVSRQERSLYIGHADLLGLYEPNKNYHQFRPCNSATSDELILVWEFWNGERWTALRTFQKEDSSSLFFFDKEDQTNLLRRSGQMRIVKNSMTEIKPLELFGQESRWLRCRLGNQLSSRNPMQLPVINTLSVSVKPTIAFSLELAFNNDIPLNLHKIHLEMKAKPGYELHIVNKLEKVSFGFVGFASSGQRNIEITISPSGDFLKPGDRLNFKNRDEEETQEIAEINYEVTPIKVTLKEVLRFSRGLATSISAFKKPPQQEDEEILIEVKAAPERLLTDDFLKFDNHFGTQEIRKIASDHPQPMGIYHKVVLEQGLEFDYDNPEATIEFVTGLRGILPPDSIKDSIVYVESLSGMDIKENSNVTLFRGSAFETALVEVVSFDTDPLTLDTLTLKGRSGALTYLAGDAIIITPEIKPFGELPALFDTFYLASDEAFSKRGAEITLHFVTSWKGKASCPSPGANNEPNPVLSWEYWNGNGWRALRVADRTNRFCMEDDVIFTCPKDIAKVEVNGEEKFWIRVRIIDGDYGKEIIVQPTNGPFPLVKQGTVYYPIIQDLTIDYEDQPRPPQKCFTLNNLDFVDRLADVLDPDRSFAPYEIIREDFASVYIGFDKKLEGGPLSILFDVDEQFLSEDDRVKMAWFYWNGNDWIQLNVQDRTEHLTKKDLLKFSVPNDFASLELFDKKLFWIKGSVIESEHNEPVKILGVFPNSTDAIQASIVNDEVLGSSNGTANQEFKLLNPLIITQEVRVTEPNRPSEEEEQEIIQGEGNNAIVELKNATGEVTGYVVRWHAVKDFDNSGPQSRHYTVDKRLGIIKFGDGDKGLVPLFGVDNLVADYKFGGGKNGNVGIGKISTLKNAIAFVSEVTNHLPADGGSETETLDEVLIRGPLELKNRERAVSAEDFESLARKASRKIVRAKCLPNTDESGEHAPGRVTVLVVPDSQQADEEPTRLLIKIAEDYLLEHTANIASAPNRIHVAGAKYVKIVVEPTLVPANLDVAARVESEALTRLKRFIHPLTGGAEQSGWEFGKKICRAEIFALLEGVPQVDHVKDLKISAKGVKQAGDVILDPFSLPFSGEHRININLNGQQTNGGHGASASECAAEPFFKDCPVN